MQFTGRRSVVSRTIKPNVPILNASSSQARGLIAWCPVGLPTQAVVELCTGTILGHLAGTRQVPTQWGRGIDCSANNLGARGNAPLQVQNRSSVSIMVVFYQAITAPVANSAYFGVSYTSTDTGGFEQLALLAGNPASDLRLSWNNAGTVADLIAVGGTPAAGTYNVVVGVIGTGAQALYLNGVSLTTGSAAISGVAASGTPIIGMGQQTADLTTRSTGAYVLDGRIWDRQLTADEARIFSLNWTDLYLPVSSSWSAGHAAAAGATGQPFYIRDIHRHPHGSIFGGGR